MNNPRLCSDGQGQGPLLSDPLRIMAQKHRRRDARHKCHELHGVIGVELLLCGALAVI